MLTPRRWTGGLVALVIAATTVLVGTPAFADYVYCPPAGGDCTVEAGTPGGGGGGSGDAGSSAKCHLTSGTGGREVPCYDQDFGWFNPIDNCYFKAYTPAPGELPDPGADKSYYLATCPYTSTPWSVPTVVGPISTPPGFGGLPSPLVLAAEAINKMALRGPNIEISPSPAGAGAVGLPVWLATGVSPTTWGPNSATAAVPGLSVTATANAQKIVWDMGDQHSITCTGHGTPYNPSYGDRSSPDCGYLYTTSSRDQPGGRYTVTGTTTWQVNWTSSDGQAGTVTVTRQSTTSIRIDEIQVVTQ
jgi:hypothetical protein